MDFLIILLVLALDAFVLWRNWASDASNATKLIWSALILLLPLVGAALWVFAGPKFRSAETDPDPDRKI